MPQAPRIKVSISRKGVASTKRLQTCLETNNFGNGALNNLFDSALFREASASELRWPNLPREPVLQGNTCYFFIVYFFKNVQSTASRRRTYVMESQPKAGGGLVPFLGRRKSPCCSDFSFLPCVQPRWRADSQRPLTRSHRLDHFLGS